MRLVILLLLALSASACSKDKSPASEANPYSGDVPAPEDLAPLKDHAQDLKTRLLAHFTEGGWVVSRDGKAAAETGDSALFTGLALAVLSCADGQPLVDALVAGIHANGGMVPRYKTNDPKDARPTSRDMVLGAMFGLLERAKKCPDDRPAVEAAWAEHYAYVKAHNGDLGPGTGNDLGSLHWLWGRASEELHATAAAAPDKGSFEVGLALTAEDIKLGKKACYPMHLGAVQMLAAERLGSPVKWQARKGYCNPETGMDLPLSDWFCERKSAAQWLGSEWQLNQWHYRHQRCGAWESPDGGAETHPAVDWLFAYWVAGGSLD